MSPKNDKFQLESRIEASSFCAGFTLIEISVALVIIGLLIGAILVGKELIETAKMRQAIKQIEQIDTGVMAFKDKYTGLPGDLLPPLAAQFNFSFRSGGNPGRGNGDGVLQTDFQVGLDSYSVYSTEFVLFWNDLSRAKLINEALDETISYLDWSCGASGSPAASRCYPKARLGGADAYINIANAGGYHYYYSNYNRPAANDYSSVRPGPYLTPEQAFARDSKVDDGNPLTGKVFAVGQGFGFAVAATGATVCANSSTSYNFTAGYAKQVICSLGIRTAF